MCIRDRYQWDKKMNQNIFEMLSDNEDSENEEKIAKEKELKKQKAKQQKEEKLLIAKNAEKIGKPEAQHQDHPKGKPVSKKVTEEPHPLDRRSGTGRGQELKKRGGGAGNWGNYKDELKVQGQIEYVPKQEQQQEQKEQKEIEPKEEQKIEKVELTLDDYKKKYQMEEQAAQEKKEKEKKEIDISQFKKEGCTLVISKAEKNIEEIVQKKGKGKKDHQMAMTSENAQLLGLTTGFKPKPYFEKPQNREQNQPKQVYKQVPDLPEEDEFEKEEKLKAQQEKEQSEQQPEHQQQQQQYEQRRPPRGGRRGGYRGGPRRQFEDQYQRKQGGDQPQEAQEGYKPRRQQNYRGKGQYNQNQQQQQYKKGGKEEKSQKLNFDNEELFPKLG
eukprot:TRINITY_DN944_c0_g1_i6.p1 TRINITY_DN944_c0_g1~~TRINITY_DN944_c0_g1_i6.p1  ORF type:complete len:438 (-),score=119.70 TRINITY_DN944_c0_g1_i6:72-1226(-)